jgi:hypothetical protein
MSLRNRSGSFGSGGGSSNAAALPRPGVNRTPSGKGGVRPPGGEQQQPPPPPPPVYQSAGSFSAPAVVPPTPPRQSPSPAAGGGYAAAGAPPPGAAGWNSQANPVSTPYQPQRPSYQYHPQGSPSTSPGGTPYGAQGVGSNGGPYGGYNNGYAAAASGYGAPTGNDYAFVNRGGGTNGSYDDDKYTKKKKKGKTSSAGGWFGGGGGGGGSGGLGGTTATKYLSVAVVALGLLYSIAITMLWLSGRGQARLLLKEVDKPSIADVIGHVKSLQRDLRLKEQQVQRSERTAQAKATQQINTLERENRLLVKDRDEWKGKYDQQAREIGGGADRHGQLERQQEEEHHKREMEHKRLTRREAAFLDQVQWLMATTKRESKRSVLEKYVGDVCGGLAILCRLVSLTGPVWVVIIFVLPCRADYVENGTLMVEFFLLPSLLLPLLSLPFRNLTFGRLGDGRFGPGPHKVEITFAVGTVDYYRTTTTEAAQPVDAQSGGTPATATTTTTTEEFTIHDERPRYSFVIELAPLDLVPHAVHLFLEQVDHGLLNGTFFYMNGPHIIQAGPQHYEDEDYGWEWEEDEDGTPGDHSIGVAAARARSRSRSRSLDEPAGGGGGASGGGGGSPTHGRRLTSEGTTPGTATDAAPPSEDGGDGHASDDEEWTDDYSDEDDEEETDEDRRIRKFADLGLDKLAFPDYSADFPHLPWTLGYTGRPGGPDWYINKLDNTKGHGPGGQRQYALDEQGDSCFGIVSPDGPGRLHLTEHAFQQEIYGDQSQWHFFVKETVEIVGAVVLTKQPLVEKVHLGHALHRHHRGTHNHTNATRRHDPSPAEEFVQVLKNALEEPQMNPASGGGPGPSSTTTASAQAAGGAPASGGAPDGNIQGRADPAVQESSDRSKHQHRRPRIPKIEGAAEA